MLFFQVLAECLGTMETLLLDKPTGRQALDEFFSQEAGRDLVQVLLSVSSPQGMQLQHYGTKVWKFHISIKIVSIKLSLKFTY